MHHRNGVGDGTHGGEVMGDEEIADAFDFLQVEQQFQNAVGNQRVERAGDLITDDQFRFCRKRAGNADPLFLTAGEFRRIAVAELLSHFDLFQQLVDTFVFFRAFQPEIQLERPADDIGDGLARVHRGVGHLIDHLQFAQVFAAALRQRR